MTTKTNTLFPDIVGQSSAKRLLEFYIKGFESTNTIPHLMFTAPRGCGKTTLATAMARHLHESFKRKTGDKKALLTVNCSSIKSLKQFFNLFVIPNMVNRDLTVLFDEASELPKDVTMALLTICNPNVENRNTFSYEDFTVEFDFCRLSFMFATTEGQSIFHALMDRMRRIDLEEYSFEELGRIVKRGLKDCEIEDKALEDISSALRGNARKAQQMAEDLVKYCKSEKVKKMKMSDWENMKKQLSIVPLGLLKKEIFILQILSRRKETRLTELAAVTGLSKSSIQKDYEMYLSRMGLIEITTNGRSLTAKGQAYVKDHCADKKK